ncbi:hypothetical protein MMPV_006815 [Pyropia vietnamensis]
MGTPVAFLAPVASPAAGLLTSRVYGVSARGVARPAAAAIRRPRGAWMKSAPPAPPPPPVESPPEDPITARVRAELDANGVELEQLLNPSLVIKLERKLEEARASLATGDGDAAAHERNITRWSAQLTKEKRQVMQLWLKRVFLGQAALSAVVSGLLATNTCPGWGDDGVPLVGRVLGFWLLWLFTVPALRARKPSKAEKSAWNVAFVGMPLLNVAVPFVSRDPALIWGVDVVFMVALYAWYVGAGKDKEEVKIRGWLRWLDWGSWK